MTNNTNTEKRRKQISSLISAYYNKFDFLRDESLDNYMNKAFDKYLDTNMSIEEINDALIEIIIKKKKNDYVNKDNNNDGFNIEYDIDNFVEKSNGLEDKKEVMLDMFNAQDTQSSNQSLENSNEKAMQFVKRNNNSQFVSSNQDGYVSKLAFIFMLLIILVLFLLGFVLLNL